jgi:HEAT repeat protein
VAAIESIGAIGGDEGAAILASLAADDGELGRAAVRTLGRVRSDGVVDILRSTLRSSGPQRRAVAVEALAAQTNPQAVDLLEWTATADPDPIVVRAALAALGDLANENGDLGLRAVRALLTSLRDPARRPAALDVLARLSPSAIPWLADSLDADDPHLRRGIVEVLSRFRHPVASACLQRALSDEDPVVRRTAIMALARLGTRGVSARLATLAKNDPSAHVRHAAVAALHRRGDGGSDGGE